ncbi:hypothetical protein EP51_46165 (plasmid) [Rhodococcus opacus]|uniref:Uncharacterized protein n=1 Tax=Rhodococcus opacus TaxID=37919 RepID=A0A076F213_RHOOP|nr:hypothetical protein EP51_46165 [Rhodococcus opacus]
MLRPNRSDPSLLRSHHRTRLRSATGHRVAGEEADNRPKLTYVTVMKSRLPLPLPDEPHQMGSPTVQQLDYPRRYALMSAAPSNDSSGRDGI